MKSGKFKLWSDSGELAVKGKLKDPKERFPLTNYYSSPTYRSSASDQNQYYVELMDPQLDCAKIV